MQCVCNAEASTGAEASTRAEASLSQNIPIDKMHFFVWLLVILLGVLIAGLVIGFIYLQSTSNEALLNSITFREIDTSFGNGILGDTLWTTDPPNHKAILASSGDLRTFLALADWLRITSMSNTSLPLYFTLPEAAVSVKTYIADQQGIPYTGDNNNLKGVLISPTHVGFKFAHDETPTDVFLTGADVTISSLQELAVIIIYTVSP